MDGTYNWDVFHQTDGSDVLVDCHLNFDVRYNVDEEMIVTGKVFKFHVEQIHPCVSICQEGKCNQPLCNMKGKLVKITQYGTISFLVVQKTWI
jgi:hypothetical protein